MANRSRFRQIRHRLRILFVVSLLFCLWFGNSSAIKLSRLAVAQSPDPSQLVRQGVELYRKGDYQSAITHWEAALPIYQDSKNLANEVVVLENLARASQQVGKFDRAIIYWNRLIASYEEQGNLTQVGRMLVEKAQSYSSLGQSRQAIAILCGAADTGEDCQTGSAWQIARLQKDEIGEAAALGSLGEAYRQKGDYQIAIQYLEHARQKGNAEYHSRILNSLGSARISQAQLADLWANSALQRGDEEQAKKFQQQANDNRQQAVTDFESSLQLAEAANDKSGQMRSLVNLVQHQYRSPQSNQFGSVSYDEAADRAVKLIEELPDTSFKVYAAIDLANLPKIESNITSPLTQCPEGKQLSDSENVQLSQKALMIARKIQDARAESFAKGAIAHLHECNQDFSNALDLNREAIWLAESNSSSRDSLFLWEWQAGRIYLKQGKEVEAIAAFQRAFQTLEKVRSDLILAERDLQFDFRDLIDPLYRKLAQLRLRSTTLSSLNPEERQQELTNAVATIESLKLAELQNYFGSDCEFDTIAQKNVDDLIGENTATIASIIFEDATAIILTLPNGDKKFHLIAENNNTIRETARRFRQGLERARRAIDNYDLTDAKKFYDWLIRPFEAELAAKNIDTLVFIQDGILRTMPMAVLNDGKQFLIEKYAIATTPSLRLTNPQDLNSRPNRALILGLTEAAKIDGQDFNALPNVPEEIAALQQLLPNSTTLVNANFDEEKLTAELNRNGYPIIHIATHAQFGTIPADTFIVTGNNRKMALNDLELTLRRTHAGANAIELLTLSACQTAVGDERSALGLAGVATQAGVRSTLASLWSVQDESTSQLIAEFYRQLSSGVSKAKALQKAQLKLIEAKKDPKVNDEYDNPNFWAPFILIGNWS